MIFILANPTYLLGRELYIAIIFLQILFTDNTQFLLVINFFPEYKLVIKISLSLV